VHVSEGILSAPVLLGGAALSAAGVAAGLKKMRPESIPEVAVLSSAFFVASLLHVPVGPANVHLTLNGLVGVLLGWTAFPSVLVALTLQALVFQFGGFTTLGVNTFVMGAPAVAAHYAFGPLVRSGARGRATLGGAGAGALGVLGGAMFIALALVETEEGFLHVAQVVAATHLPVALAEGALTAFVVLFLRKVKPEMLEVR
jgi:cobalt/nickel transport system permease protein